MPSRSVMNACANMVLTDAIEDFASENNISIAEARDILLSSEACEGLYDFDTKLWAEGPDYFRCFYETVERGKKSKESGSS